MYLKGFLIFGALSFVLSSSLVHAESLEDSIMNKVQNDHDREMKSGAIQSQARQVNGDRHSVLPSNDRSSARLRDKAAMVGGKPTTIVGNSASPAKQLAQRPAAIEQKVAQKN